MMLRNAPVLEEGHQLMADGNNSRDSGGKRRAGQEEWAPLVKWELLRRRWTAQLGTGITVSGG